MRRTGEYNGHHCWNCWNVALWIGNDEGLYRAALGIRQRAFKRGHYRSNLAARLFLTEVVGDSARTPEGARYTHKAVKAALEGLE
jgi:hypothetical protein